MSPSPLAQALEARDGAPLRDNLIAALALIDTPEKWGKGPDGVNQPTIGLCAMNACVEITGLGWPLLVALQNQLPDGPWLKSLLPVAAYNDDPETTHADIMALFDRAIEATLGEQLTFAQLLELGGRTGFPSPEATDEDQDEATAAIMFEAF